MHWSCDKNRISIDPNKPEKFECALSIKFFNDLLYEFLRDFLFLQIALNRLLVVFFMLEIKSFWSSTFILYPINPVEAEQSLFPPNPLWEFIFGVAASQYTGLPVSPSACLPACQFQLAS